MSKLVLDVGGSAIKWAVMDDDAAILEKGEIKTPLDSFESFMKAVVELYESKADIEGIAISLPGNIDVSTGYVYAPGALSFNANRNIVDEIHKYIKLPVSVENDGKCAALAEVWKGKLKDHKDGIVLIIGTGIGGGVVIDRKVLKGQHFFAGEFSYLITDINQPDFVDKGQKQSGGAQPDEQPGAMPDAEPRRGFGRQEARSGQHLLHVHGWRR